MKLNPNHIDYEIFRQLAVRTSSIIFIDYNPAYKDNPFLSAEQVAEIESNKDDANWWKVYGQGIEGTLDGLIYDLSQT